MKITTVRFRQLKSHDRGYGHNAIEAEAAVDDGETPDEALIALREWVQSSLDEAFEREKLYQKLSDIRLNIERETREVERKTRELTELRGRISAGQEIIGKHDLLADLAREQGIVVEGLDLLGDGIPF